MQFSNTSNFAKFLKLVTGLIVSRTNLILQVPGYIRQNTPVILVPSVSAIQVDDTLDPGGAPTLGDAYIITDASELNANFGAIAGVEDNDIVRFDGVDFVVALDISDVAPPDGTARTYVQDVDKDYDFFTAFGWRSLTVDYYIDWFDLSIIPESQETTVQQLTVNASKTIFYSQLATPNGDTLDLYDKVTSDAQFFAASLWNYPGDFIFDTTFNLSSGLSAGRFESQSIALVSGIVGMSADQNSCGGSKITAQNDSAFVRIHLTGTRR